MPNPSRRGAKLHPLTIQLGRAFAASLLMLVLGGAAAVAAADIGHKDFSDSGGSAVTGSKPESKLWFNDGFWWASMQPSTGGGFFIYKLDPGTDTWISTGTPLDNRSGSRADTLWDGTKLYVATQVYSADGGTTGTGSSFEARLYRFSYNISTDTYSLDNLSGTSSKYAILRSGLKSETLVIAKDSTDTLWATWTQKGTLSGTNLVKISHTVNHNDATWSAPVTLPIGVQPIGVTTANDDISTIIAFGTGSASRIGVFWGNQADDKDYFAWRADTDDPDAAIWTGETALSGTGQADDHANIKTDSSGQVYVVVKTSLTGANPLIKLLRRTTTGSWSNFVVGIDNVGSNTRPILELEEKGSGNVLHVFMTGARTSGGSGQSGGDIFEKTSPTSAISFAAGLGTPVIRDDASAKMNNPTSTKQNVNSTSGVVVLAFNDTTNIDTYWHAREAFGPPPDPLASFTAAPTSGAPGLSVNFANTSTGTPTLTYAWDFGDPGSGADNTSTATNPSHTYLNPATYTVKLTVKNGNNVLNTLTQTNLITVTAPTGTITLTPDADAQILSTSPTNNYGALASIRTRTDPGTGSTYRTYLRFNVTGLTGTVTGVKLRLFTSDASSDIQSVFATAIIPTPAWIETGPNGGAAINWNNAPTIGSTLLGSASVPTLGAYNEIPLSTSAISGNGLVTFAIKSSAANSGIFNSKEALAPTNAPQLVITQTVGPPNTTPTANDVPKTTDEDTLASITLAGSDVETCGLTFAFLQPANGTVSGLNSPAGCDTGSTPFLDSATVNYQPKPNFNGTDTFTYTVSDGTNTSAPATVTVTVTSINDTPTADNISVIVAQGNPTVITLTGGDVETCNPTFAVVAQPLNGSLAGGGTITNLPCAGTGPFTDSAQVTYTATSGTSDSFTYKVTDGNATDSLPATVTITITPPNTTPTANDVPKTTDEDTLASITLAGSDVETCGLTFAFLQPANGTVSGLNSPAGCDTGSTPFLDSATVNYQPKPNFNGTDTFTYTVSDGTNTSAPATVTVTVTSINDVPTATAVVVTATQNTPKTVTLTGTDVETCPLTFTPSAALHGTVTAPSDQGCVGTGPFTDTLNVTYTPTSGYTGPDSFTYTVFDGAATSASKTVSITVNSLSPTTLTVPIAFDSQVNSGSATSNYGTVTPVRSREGTGAAGDPIYRGYFQFSVPSFSGTVQSAKLRVFVATAGNSTALQTAYSVASNWTELGITFSNAPGLGTVGPGSVAASTVGVYIELPIDPTTIVSNAPNSFAVKNAGTSSAYFNSREAGANPPQLVIVYQ